MWLLASARRVGNLRRFFRACREVGVSTPGLVLINTPELEEKRAEYDALDLPQGWKVIGVDADSFHDALRAAWPLVKDLKWVGVLQDDLVPGTPGWDAALIKQLSGWNVVSAFDGQQQRMTGAIAFSGELLRTVGGIYPLGTKHLFGDDYWETIGRATGCWLLDMQVITSHVNETYSQNGDATAAKINSFTEHDKAKFDAWAATEKDATIQKVLALKERLGAKDIKVDFSNMSILIVTPSVDYKFEGSYLASLSDTMRNLTALNVPCGWAVEKYNADIALARSNLFSQFLRSQFTHCLMIDADMGWEFSAIMRLIAAKRDFVAVAGPKKSYPLRFAANHTDENENIIHLQVNPDNGTADVTEVGAAFALLSKAAAMKVAQMHPETRFRGVGDQECFGVFMPMIHRDRYKAEDFAFCRRLLAAGIRPGICPDVPLSHTGAHTFRGALLDQFKMPTVRPELQPGGFGMAAE